MDNNEDKPVQEVISKDLAFKQYSSIELSTRDKFVNSIKKSGFDSKEILWVASQKIHGCNFSIHYNGEAARYGRRTDFITKDIPVPCENVGEYFLQSFYDARALVVKFHNKLSAIYDNIRKAEPDLLKISIYGEYFGGNWPANEPHALKNGPKHVQKGVCYTPNHEFFVFDIFITCKERIYWADVLDIPKYLDNNIASVPVYAKGTFEQMMDVEIKIDSTIPELLGLPKLPNNLIQGMVIRPNKNLSTEHHSRVILKKKNAQFNEKATEPNPAKKEKKEKALDPQIIPYIEELSKYLNFNRITSVVSKFPDLKDRNKLKQQTVKDIMTDAEKDQYKRPEKEEINKKVTEEFDKIVLKEINSYFVKH